MSLLSEFHGRIDRAEVQMLLRRVDFRIHPMELVARVNIFVPMTSHDVRHLHWKKRLTMEKSNVPLYLEHNSQLHTRLTVREEHHQFPNSSIICKITMASTTINNNNNNDNSSDDDSIHMTIEKSGIGFASAQHGGVPISVPVDASELQLRLQELRRALDWNNIPRRKAADLAKKIQDAKANESSEFAEWS